MTPFVLHDRKEADTANRIHEVADDRHRAVQPYRKARTGSRAELEAIDIREAEATDQIDGRAQQRLPSPRREVLDNGAKDEEHAAQKRNEVGPREVSHDEVERPGREE